MELDPPLDSPAYRSTALRAPKHAPLRVEAARLERTGPVFGESDVRAGEHDLTRGGRGEPLGERIVV
ncbi:MAG: protocatechuate 3,4-dioxygenase subunit beta, partial [Myxococcota bacterium]